MEEVFTFTTTKSLIDSWGDLVYNGKLPEQIPVMPTPCVIVENPSKTPHIKELDATPEADEPIYTTQHYNPDQDRNE